MSREEEMEVLVSQPLPRAGSLAWIWLCVRAAEAVPATIRLVNSSSNEVVREIACEALRSMYLGRAFTSLCRPGMELQVLVPRRAGAATIARCETRFGFSAAAEETNGAGDIVEQRYQPTGRAKDAQQRQLIVLKPREQRLTFMTVAYVCRSTAATLGMGATLYLEMNTAGAASQRLEPVCTVLPRQTVEGVFEVPPNVLGSILPHSKLACVRSDSTMQVLDLHVEVGYLPHYHRMAFQSMLQDPTFADVTLVSEEGSQFPAHRAILAARSPVFHSMFCGGMREASEKEVCLDDIHGSVLADVLQFIYTGELEEEKLAGSVDALALAANRLQIEDLVSVCCNFMVTGLDEDNVLSIFQLADDCNFSDLRGAAKRFIAKSLPELQRRDEYALLPAAVRAELERAVKEANA